MAKPVQDRRIRGISELAWRNLKVIAVKTNTSMGAALNKILEKLK